MMPINFVGHKASCLYFSLIFVSLILALSLTTGRGIILWRSLEDDEESGVGGKYKGICLRRTNAPSSMTDKNKGRI
jgi:hypothetical protein